MDEQPGTRAALCTTSPFSFFFIVVVVEYVQLSAKNDREYRDKNKQNPAGDAVLWEKGGGVGVRQWRIMIRPTA